jgi:uncharacterized protein (TIGR02145 family)
LITGCKKDSIDPPAPVTDIEGNIYKTVRIGSQIWMGENLKTTKLNDGTAIPLVTGSAAWTNLTSPGYTMYNGQDTSYKKKYGLLYNGYSCSVNNICPTGWHIPNNEDFNKLKETLGDSISAGGKLKETGILKWKSPNSGASNNSGFQAVPSGFRYFDGSYAAFSLFTAFWVQEEPDIDSKNYFSLSYNDSKIKYGQVSKNFGFSVRCIKD